MSSEIGVGIATVTGGIAAGYYATAAVVVVLAIPYVLGSRDIALPRRLRPAFSWREFLSGFWISPRRYPDFAWAWLTRFLVNFGNSLGTLLLYFYLQDAVGYGDPEAGVFVLTIVYAVFIVVNAVGAAVGFLSGVFGVGGGFLLTPLLIFIGVPPTVAVPRMVGMPARVPGRYP